MVWVFGNIEQAVFFGIDRGSAHCSMCHWSLSTASLRLKMTRIAIDQQLQLPFLRPIRHYSLNAIFLN